MKKCLIVAKEKRGKQEAMQNMGKKRYIRSALGIVGTEPGTTASFTGKYEKLLLCTSCMASSIPPLGGQKWDGTRNYERMRGAHGHGGRVLPCLIEIGAKVVLRIWTRVGIGTKSWERWPCLVLTGAPAESSVALCLEVLAYNSLFLETGHVPVYLFL